MTTSLTPTTGRTTHLCGVCRPSWPARWRCTDGGELTHAVEAHRSTDELDGEPELAVCGAVVAVVGHPWSVDGWTAASTVETPVGAPCPVCSSLVAGRPSTAAVTG